MSSSSSSAFHCRHRQARSAWREPEQRETCTCTLSTRDATQSSWWSLPSCGTQAWSVLRNPAVCDRNDAYPGRTGRPCSLVLGNLVHGVLLALLACAECTFHLWSCHHDSCWGPH